MGRPMNLYSRLLRYQQTEEHSNLENLTSEMLCDFLKKLRLDEAREFSRQVLFDEMDSHFFKQWMEPVDPIGAAIEGTRELTELQQDPVIVLNGFYLPYQNQYQKQ